METAGGSAPEGYAGLFNAAFTVVSAVQLWVTYASGEAESGDMAHEGHAH